MENFKNRIRDFEFEILHHQDEDTLGVAMTTKHKNKLKLHGQQLIDHVQVDDVIHYLYQQNVLSEDIYSKLQDERKNREEKVCLLIDFLPMKGEGAFMYFVYSLKIHAKQQQLVDLISDTDDWEFWPKLEKDIRKNRSNLLGIIPGDVAHSAAAWDKPELQAEDHVAASSKRVGLEKGYTASSTDTEVMSSTAIVSSLSAATGKQQLSDSELCSSDNKRELENSTPSESDVSNVCCTSKKRRMENSESNEDDAFADDEGSSDGENDDTNTEDNNPVGPPRWVTELRKYQKELAIPGLRDLYNYILVAPTGSGKTRVAAYIIYTRLQEDPDTKAVFLAPTVALVKQHNQELRQLLPDWEVDYLTGDSVSLKPPLEDMLDMNSVVCVTPMLLYNSLKDGRVKFENMNLMVFDECHHAQQQFPYNLIMGMYVDQKLGKVPMYKDLPQVVGMTASLGVGSAKQIMSAKQHILNISSNMDARCIQSVGRYIDELRQYVKEPEEVTKTVPCRIGQDPFSALIISTMKEIERTISAAKVADTVVYEKAEFPEERHKATDYINYLYKLGRELMQLIPGTEDVTRRRIIACLRHLQAYSQALAVHAEVRAIDALEVLNCAFGHELKSPEFLDMSEKWLVDLFSANRPHLVKLCSDERCQNPKLVGLKGLIMEIYSKNPETLSILFTTTRDSTKALKDWMLKDPQLQHLNPNRLTGQTPEGRSGMSSATQESVLKYFKGGFHKMLISTSVAEEGLDIRVCNVVFTYNYTTNEVGRIQTKGRVRQQDGQYIVITSEDKAILREKEAMNLYRERLMKRVIVEISQASEDEFRKCLLHLQRTASREREFRKAEDMAKESSKTFRKLTMCCYKCPGPQIICTTEQMRMFKYSNNKHMVCIKPQFEDMIQTEVHKKTQIFDNLLKKSKIACEKCNTDWGVIMVYKKKVNFPMLKPEGFRFLDEKGRSITGAQTSSWPDIDYYKITEKELCAIFKDKYHG